MVKFLRLLQTLDYVRMVVGICILVDGYPLIFFFRDSLQLAPGNTTFTAVGFAGGLLLMIPFTLMRRLYRPNMTMFWMAIVFLLFCILYMYMYPVAGFADYQRDMTYYAFIFIFLFLLINIPNDIIRVVIPVIVIFTLISNLGLIYSLIKDPTWVIGQRATIVLNNSEDGSGNPHVFARNAYMGVIACAIWLMRPQTSFLFRLLSLFAGILNIVILVLTQTRSSIVALVIAIVLFMYFNVRPAQIRMAVRSIFKPIPILIMAAGVVGIIIFFNRYTDVYSVLYGYVMSFTERNLENLYALIGLKAEGTNFKATLDDSAANRTGSINFLANILVAQMHSLILGYGYKFQFLDVPIIEALTNQGILGFALFGGVNAMIIYYSIKIMRDNPNQLSVFLAYFYALIFVQILTGGRPYDIGFWFPLSLMIRFMGVEHLFPAYLMDNPVKAKY